MKAATDGGQNVQSQDLVELDPCFCAPLPNHLCCVVLPSYRQDKLGFSGQCSVFKPQSGTLIRDIDDTGIDPPFIGIKDHFKACGTSATSELHELSSAQNAYKNLNSDHLDPKRDGI